MAIQIRKYIWLARLTDFIRSDCLFYSYLSNLQSMTENESRNVEKYLGQKSLHLWQALLVSQLKMYESGNVQRNG